MQWAHKISVPQENLTVVIWSLIYVRNKWNISINFVHFVNQHSRIIVTWTILLESSHTQERSIYEWMKDDIHNWCQKCGDSIIPLHMYYLHTWTRIYWPEPVMIMKDKELYHSCPSKLFAKRGCHKDRCSPMGMFMCAGFALRLQILQRNNRYSLKTAHARYMSIKIVNFLVLGQIVQLLGQSDLNIKPLFFLIFMFSDELEPLLIP